MRRGWMPLDATGVGAFAARYPRADGRGVLVAILDSGIDPSVPGLQRTSTGDAKILDLRDFSGEGRIRLEPVVIRQDSLVVMGQAMAGLSRIRAFDADGPWYSGIISERDLGDPQAADLNGDGDANDTLAVVVTRASDGWVLFADRGGDGSLANDPPVHDYQVAREWFGWAPAGQDPFVALAVNVTEAAGAPILDLYFDTSGHGTHVAGIAAGHDMYGVAGFDGVAPGAQLLGLKIADDAQGGISTTGSMLRAMDYAIRYAAQRRLPLVLNMSFGVGNEREGAAVIDRLVDSVLAANPQVTFTIAAGNDGPGISTLGFPGSAQRAIAVGALLPGVFLTPDDGPAVPDAVADFSSRGGEVAGPHIVVPGMAYSTVPAWDRGNERKAGTSMATPHAAGLAARLLAAARDRGLAPGGATVRQALMVTAAPAPGASFIDAGTGVPNLSRAWAWLEAHPDVSLMQVSAAPGFTAVLLDSAGVARFHLAGAPAGAMALALRSQVSWLNPPASVPLRDGAADVVLRPSAAVFREPGIHTAVVQAWGPDSTVGPLARMVTTVRVPWRTDTIVLTQPLARGQTLRVPFEVLPGRPFTIELDGGAAAGVVTYLHEPGGMPFRGGHEQAAGSGEAAATFEVLLQDAVPGTWELVVQGSPFSDTRLTGGILRAPVTLAPGTSPGGGPRVMLGSASSVAVAADGGAALIGAMHDTVLAFRGSARHDLEVRVPAWARSLQVDVRVDPGMWTRFTDLGLTLFDAEGTQLVTQPLNYAVGRLEHSLGPANHDRTYRLSLYPGFAAPSDSAPWRVAIATRFFTDSARTLAPAGDRQVHIAPGTSAALAWQHGGTFPMAGGLVPLYLVLVRTSEQGIWASEVAGGAHGEAAHP